MRTRCEIGLWRAGALQALWPSTCREGKGCFPAEENTAWSIMFRVELFDDRLRGPSDEDTFAFRRFVSCNTFTLIFRALLSR